MEIKLPETETAVLIKYSDCNYREEWQFTCHEITSKMRRRPKRESEEREAKCSSMCGIKTMCTGRINMAPEHGSLPLVGVHLQDWSLRMSWRQRLCLRSAGSLLHPFRRYRQDSEFLFSIVISV